MTNYHGWHIYGEPDGPLEMAFWVLYPGAESREPPILVDCGFDPELGERRGRHCSPAEALQGLGIGSRAIGRLVSLTGTTTTSGTLACFQMLD